MKCKEYDKLIQKDMNGELRGDKKTELMAHLEACHECRKSYDQFEEVNTLLNAHPQIEGNNFLTERIVEAALHSEKPRPRYKNYSFEMKLASSLICTGVFVLVINIAAMQNDIFFVQGLQHTIMSFNDLMAEMWSKISQSPIF